MAAAIQLQPLTARTWRDCAALRVADDQRGFVRDNLYSIAEAQFYPDVRSRAVLAGATLVGYALWGIDDASGQWKLFRLMIDAAQQGKGYGRAAMALVLGDIAAQPTRSDTLLRVATANTRAIGLYARLGFRPDLEQGDHLQLRLPAEALIAGWGPHDDDGVLAITHNGHNIIEGHPALPLVRKASQITRLFEHGFGASTSDFLVYPTNLPPGTFDLSSGDAGEIIGKLNTYHARIAVVAPPGAVAFSSRFAEVMAEEQKGNAFRLYPTRAEALAWLAATQA